MNLLFCLVAMGAPQGAESGLERFEREIAAVVEKTQPSVVRIVATRAEDDFQLAEPDSRQFSGFVVSADGHIMTDYGPVATARKLIVTLHDGRRFAASVKAFDRPSAVALLRVPAEGLQAVEFADPETIRQGSFALLLSNPAGLHRSFSVGFVTGLDRSVAVNGARYDDMIQTSAAVQSGDGGGLLANSRGLAIGMIHSRYVADGLAPDPAGFVRPDFLRGSGPTIGFATPASTLKFVAERLLKEGRVTRGWVGLALRNGGLVADVTRDAPAWKAGLRRNDRLIEFDGLPGASLAAIRRSVVQSSTPRTVRVRVQRGPAQFDADVTIEPEP